MTAGVIDAFLLDDASNRKNEYIKMPPSKHPRRPHDLPHVPHICLPTT